MKKSVLVFIVLCFFSTTILLSGNCNAQDLCGTWMTACSGAKINIQKKDKDLYEGTLVWTKDNNEESRKKLGTIIVKDLRKTGKNTYEGYVIDPEKNKTYNSTITIISDKIIELRGYIRIPLFGKTEKWTKCK